MPRLLARRQLETDPLAVAQNAFRRGRAETREVRVEQPVVGGAVE